MPESDFDDRLRVAAFAYLNSLRAQFGDRLTSQQLAAFEFEGKPLSLLQHMRGIRTVSGLEAALSIRTTYAARPEDRPYEDGEGPDGYLRYKWRGTDADAFDNVALRRAMELSRPLMYFMGIGPGQFVALYPIWLVGEESGQHQFVVAIDETMREQWQDAVFFIPLTKLFGASTQNGLYERACINARSENAFCWPTAPSAHYVRFVTWNFSMQLISRKTLMAESRSCLTESRCAQFTIGPSMLRFSGFGRTTSLRSGVMCSRKAMDQRCATLSRAFIWNRW